jgi:hypothetical protein
MQRVGKTAGASAGRQCRPAGRRQCRPQPSHCLMGGGALFPMVAMSSGKGNGKQDGQIIARYTRGDRERR